MLIGVVPDTGRRDPYGDEVRDLGLVRFRPMRLKSSYSGCMNWTTCEGAKPAN